MPRRVERQPLRVPGPSYSVRNGETGILVPFHDLGALAEAITRILTNEELRVSLSRNAVKWAGNFDWERTAKKTLERLRHL